MNMYEAETIKLLVTMLLSNLQGMKRNIDHTIQTKLLSKCGMSPNQVIRAHNQLGEVLVEQMGQVAMILKTGSAVEQPMDIAGALANVLGNAPQAKLDAPPGWTKDANGNWVTTK